MIGVLHAPRHSGDDIFDVDGFLEIGRVCELRGYHGVRIAGREDTLGALRSNLAREREDRNPADVDVENCGRDAFAPQNIEAVIQRAGVPAFGPGRAMSAIFIADGVFDPDHIAEKFAIESASLPPRVRSFLLEKIRNYALAPPVS